MLVFGLPQSPASQPWNLVGGHLVSAFVGVSCHFLLSNEVLASSVAIPLAMLVMHVGGPAVYELGYFFLVIPVFFNSIIILSFALAAGTLREKNPYLKGE